MRENLKDDVARHIRDGILSGELKPRSRIDQEAVAESLGVSRLPVREALIMLEAEGLVDTRARRGSYVAAVTRIDIRDHFAMFGLMSGLAAEHAAANLDDEALQALEMNIDQMAATGDPREADRLNIEFHRTINRAGASRRLRSVLRLLANNMPTHFFEFNDEKAKGRSVEQHRDILRALKAGDGPGAVAALDQHFRVVGDEAVAYLVSSGFWEGNGGEDRDAFDGGS